MIRIIAVCAVVTVNATFNPDFDALWPLSLNGVIAQTYADTGQACSNKQSSTCIGAIARMLSQLRSNLATISGLLGTSGSMTNWFIPNSARGTISTMQSNYNYANTVMSALATLVSGTGESLISLVGTNYPNFATSVSQARTALVSLTTDAAKLTPLIGSLTYPIKQKIATAASHADDKALRLLEDIASVIFLVEQSVTYLTDKHTDAITGFADGVSDLIDYRDELKENMMDDIIEILGFVDADVKSVSSWNEEKATLVGDVNNAILKATEALPSVDAENFQTALNDESTLLDTNVVGPAELAFGAIHTNYQTTSGENVTYYTTSETNLASEYQGYIDTNVSVVSNLSEFYGNQIQQIGLNITDSAKSSLTGVNETLILENTTQTLWQAEINGYIENIAESLEGVKAASTAYEATSQTLATAVLQKFQDMLTSVTQAALAAGKISAVATGSAPHPEEGDDPYGEGASKAESGTSDQISAVSTSTVNMMGSLADLLLTLQSLMNLMQAKMGSSADGSTTALDLVNKVASGNAQDLAQTMSDISAQQQSKLLEAEESGFAGASDSSNTVGDIVDSAGAKTFKLVNDAQNMYADSDTASKEQIDDLAAQIKAASSVGTNLEDAQSSISSDSKRTLGVLKTDASSLKTLLENAASGMQVALTGAQAAVMSNLDRLNNSLFDELETTATETNTTVLEQIQNFKTYLEGIDKFDMTFSTDKISTDSAVSLSEIGGEIELAVDSFNSENEALKVALAGNLSTAINTFSEAVLEDQADDIDDIKDLVSLMGDSTRVKHIADVQTASRANFSSIQTTAYTTLGELSETNASETAIGIYASALNGSMIDLQSQVLDSFANATSQATNDSTFALEIIQNETTRGLNTSQALNDLILKTQEELNALNVSVQAQITNSTSAIDLNAVVDHLNQFLGAVLAQQSQYFNITSNQAALRAAIITGQQADMHLLGAQEKIDLIAGKADYASRQTRVLSVANQLTNTIGNLAASSGADVSALLDNLASIRGISDSLSSSLQSYVSSAASRMEEETKLAGQKLKNLAKGNVMTRSLAAVSVGNSIVNSISNFNTSSQSIATLASYSKGGLVGVGQMVQDLSTGQAIQLQMILYQVGAGKMTLQQALANAVEMSTADLSNIGDVASAFATIIYQYIGLTEQTYADAEDLLDNFQASASGTIAEYEAALRESLASVSGLVSLGQNVSGDMSNGFEASLAAVRGNLTAETGRDSDEAVSVGNTTSFITGLIKNATLRFSDIDKAENSAIQTLTNWAQINLHKMLAAVSNADSVMSIDSGNLQWSGN